MSGHAPQDQALRVATRALVRAAGGQEAAGAFVGKPQQRISQYATPHDKAWMPLDAVARLEDVTASEPGHPHVTRELAQRQGYALVRLPTARTVEAGWMEHLACCQRESGRLLTDFTKDLADAKIDRAEAAELRGDLRALLAALVDLDAALEPVIDTG